MIGYKLVYKWRWAKDGWGTKQTPFKKAPWCYDKFWHCTLSAVMGALCSLITPLAGLIIATSFWFLWEVKDAYIPWEDPRFTTWFPFIGEMNWGGDGFSWKDMVSSWIGAIIIFSLTLIL